MDEPVDASFSNRREVRERDGEEVQHHCHRLTVEIAAAQQLARLEDEWIVGRGVELATDDRRGKIDRVEHRSVHLRHASQTVRILYPRITVPMRLTNLAVGKQLALQRRRCCLPELSAILMYELIERDGRTEQRLERHRAGDVRESAEAIALDDL